MPSGRETRTFRTARPLAMLVVLVPLVAFACGCGGSAPLGAPIAPPPDDFGSGPSGPTGSSGGGPAGGPTGAPEKGMLVVEAVTGAIYADYDILDQATGEKVLTYQHAGEPVLLEPGIYCLTRYFTPALVYASGVSVTAGNTTRVILGAIKLVTVAGAYDGRYDIYDADGTTKFASYNEENAIVTTPAGTFTLKEYFNDKFTYAADVVVAAGDTTVVEMGAIRYDGAFDYDIYAGGVLVASYNEPGLIITAPPGTYSLYKYFDDRLVLASGVVVTAGATTVVP